MAIFSSIIIHFTRLVGAADKRRAVLLWTLYNLLVNLPPQVLRQHLEYVYHQSERQKENPKLYSIKG